MSSPPDLATPVSVVIATAGAGAVVWDEPRSFVVEAVRGLHATTRHPDVELVVVHDSTTSAATQAALVEIPGLDLTLVPVDGPLSRAAAWNVGALHASGEVLVFCDERTQARSDEMLGHLIAPLRHLDVAMSGPKLLDDDGVVKGAGIDVVDGVVEHPWRGLPDTAQTSPELFRDRVVDALDETCVAVRATAFGAVGGWSQEIPARFRDLDLGLKLRREGHTLLWVSAAELWCFARDRRATGARRWEVDFLRRRWGKTLSPSR